MVDNTKNGTNSYYDITLITPILNGKQYIERLLQSIKNQTGAISIQHIVVDGGSTDGTIDLLQKYGTEHYVVEGSSIYEAHNFGLTKSQADAVAFINCDDYYTSADVISRMLHELRKNESLEIVYGTCNFISGDGSLLYKMIPPKKIIYKFAKLRLFNISHPCWVARKSVFAKVGDYDTQWKFVSDMDFILRASRNQCNFKRVELAVVDFVIHDNNASGTREASLEVKKFLEHMNGDKLLARFLYLCFLGALYLKDPRYVYFWTNRFFKRFLLKD